jgi:hypothetical protein
MGPSSFNLVRHDREDSSYGNAVEMVLSYSIGEKTAVRQQNLLRINPRYKPMLSWRFFSKKKSIFDCRVP